jgi:hypothetical protein
VRFFIHAPIPPPRLWVASLDAEPPPGHLRLIGASVSPRTRARHSGTGTDLVAVEDASDDTLRVQCARLLSLFCALDAAAREKVLTYAIEVGTP